MLPALTPTQTVSGNDGRRSARPDSRIQWHRYVASPPSTSSTSASRTQGTQRSAPMLGSAVSSRTPTDLQPRAGHAPPEARRLTKLPHRGRPAHRVAPLRRRDAEGVGVGDRLAEQVDQRRWMLGLVTPPDVRSSLRSLHGRRPGGPGLLRSARCWSRRAGGPRAVAGSRLPWAGRGGHAEGVGGHRQRPVGVPVDEHSGVAGLPGSVGQAGEVERRDEVVGSRDGVRVVARGRRARRSSVGSVSMRPSRPRRSAAAQS